MDMELAREPREVHGPVAAAVILLDTNALIWLQQGHARTARLARSRARLYLSPASLLEIQFLLEQGRIKLRRNASFSDLQTDNRWLQDDPPSAAWFRQACAVGWTHDPFDRLLVAHMRLRHWRLATGDAGIVEHLEPDEYIEL
jgi:PIN domain nuclease of toxin-antitoxin system